MINGFTTEKVYKDMLYINSLIKKHTLDDKLLFKLKNQILICIFFIWEQCHSMIMTSAFMAISILKQSSILEKATYKLLILFITRSVERIIV